MVSFYVFLTRNIFIFFINFKFCNCDILFEGTVWSICGEVPLNPSQSVSQSVYQFLQLVVDADIASCEAVLEY